MTLLIDTARAIEPIEGIELTGAGNTYFRLHGYTAYVTLTEMRDGVVQVGIKYNRRTNNKSFNNVSDVVAHITRWSKRIKGDIAASVASAQAYEERRNKDVTEMKVQLAVVGGEYVCAHFSHHAKLPGVDTPQPIYMNNDRVMLDLRLGDIARSVTLDQALTIFKLVK